MEKLQKCNIVVEVEYLQLQRDTCIHREWKNTRYLFESSQDYLRTLEVYME